MTWNDVTQTLPNHDQNVKIKDAFPGVCGPVESRTGCQTTEISIVGDGFYFTAAEGNKIVVKPNWIKCSDRPPPENIWLLLGSSSLKYVDTGIYIDRGDGTKCFKDPDRGYFIYAQVTHWMFLPEPPHDN